MGVEFEPTENGTVKVTLTYEIPLMEFLMSAETIKRIAGPAPAPDSNARMQVTDQEGS